MAHTMGNLVVSKQGKRSALGMQPGKGCLVGMGLLLTGVQEVGRERDFWLVPVLPVEQLFLLCLGNAV
jgi:hypothetical protein